MTRCGAVAATVVTIAILVLMDVAVTVEGVVVVDAVDIVVGGVFGSADTPC